MNPDLLQIVYALVGAGAVYGGIRADLRSMHERIKEAQETAKQAHARLDIHLERRNAP